MSSKARTRRLPSKVYGDIAESGNYEVKANPAHDCDLFFVLF